VFVVEELGVIEIGGLDVGGSAIRDGSDIRSQAFVIMAVETFESLAERLGNSASQCLAGGEPVSFRILYVEAGCTFFLLCHTFYNKAFPHALNAFEHSRKTCDKSWVLHLSHYYHLVV